MAPESERLAASGLLADPVQQFRRWFAEARADPRVGLAEAACLSTLGPNRTPEGRMVLVKHFDGRGFVFYTNLKSGKARSLAAHPKAGLTFYWEPLGRQARIRGPVESVSPNEADAYFATRPRGSRIGAWASEQSRELEGRPTLEARVRALEARFAGRSIPRPPDWSGFRLVPDAMEFWQEGSSRLHDRFLYLRVDGGPWTRRRLYP